MQQPSSFRLAALCGAAVFMAVSVASALFAPAALAQSGSNRPARLIVPLQAGSSNAMVTRIIAPHLSAALGQTFVVENKVGGNGVIGAMEVVRAAPDGTTLLAGSNSPMAANVAFMKSMPYDPRRDLTPVAGLAQTHWVLLVKPTAPIHTMAEFIAYAKARPGKVSVGYSTTAVQTQIATIGKLGGVQLLPVPYKGAPATITDVTGGTLDATLTDPGNASAQVKGGTLRAVAVSSGKRNPNYPDWPAISETLPDYDFRAWNAIAGPPGMARDLVLRLSNAVADALKKPEVIEGYSHHGSSTLIMSADALRKFIETETDKWARLAKEANIQPE